MERLAPHVAESNQLHVNRPFLIVLEAAVEPSYFYKRLGGLSVSGRLSGTGGGCRGAGVCSISRTVG
jgi:hypothetical protein